MGNWANDLISHGFYDEARNVLDGVAPEDREDNQVVNATSRLETHPEHEDQELGKFLDASTTQHELMLQAVEAEQNIELINTPTEEFAGRWMSPNEATMILEFGNSSGLLKGDLTGELTEPTTSGALGSIFGPPQPATPNQFKIYMKRDGLSLDGQAIGLPKTESRTFLGSGAPPKRNYALVLISKSELRGYFWIDDIKQPREISFERV
jgi:hypothetical protein